MVFRLLPFIPFIPFITGATCRCLAVYWWDHQTQLEKWIHDWLMKEQFEPEESAQHPVNKTLVCNIQENDSQGGLPIHNE